jgi:hypothetical protein
MTRPSISKRSTRTPRKIPPSLSETARAFAFVPNDPNWIVNLSAAPAGSVPPRAGDAPDSPPPACFSSFAFDFDAAKSWIFSLALPASNDRGNSSISERYLSSAFSRSPDRSRHSASLKAAIGLRFDRRTLSYFAIASASRPSSASISARASALHDEYSPLVISANPAAAPALSPSCRRERAMKYAALSASRSGPSAFLSARS